MANNRLDLVIFGATGFTGKYTVKEAERLAKTAPFTWGVAGRNKEALESVVKKFAPESENVIIIVADLKDEESLKRMAEKAKVIVNCCGPYRFYGEPVIKACIAAKTHHVDVSGEQQYMERMQLEYNKAAQDAGVYIVSACGFDSIPCDLGIIFTQNKYGAGEANTVETYLNSWETSKVGGASIHYGTWESAVYSLAHENELHDLNKKLFPEKLPEFKPKLKPRLFHTHAQSDGWSFLFPSPDHSVALRTQRFLYDKYKQRPAQVQTYVTFKSLISALMTGIIAGALLILTKFETSRNLLLKYPSFFSGGYINHKGPKLEKMESTYFSITFVAKGWSERVPITDQHTEPPNKEVITKVSGKNPGYGVTSTALLISAITILNEFDKMPDNGGVLTPGAAFGKTSMIEKLNKNGVKFEIVSEVK